MPSISLSYDRGTHDLKGIPDQWQILAVVADPPA